MVALLSLPFYFNDVLFDAADSLLGCEEGKESSSCECKKEHDIP